MGEQMREEKRVWQGEHREEPQVVIGEAQAQQEAQAHQEAQATASMQLVEQYAREGVETIPVERLEEMQKGFMATKARVTAEKLRLGIERQATKTKPAPPGNPPPAPENATVQMTRRQRKKAEKRKESNVKKARRRGYREATEETLPLAQEIQRLNREGLPPVDLSDWRESLGVFQFSEDLFTASPDAGKELSLDVTMIRRYIQVAEAFKQKCEEDLGLLNIEETARYEVMTEMLQRAKDALRVWAGSHGVDSETGESIADGERITKYREEREETVNRYRTMAAKPRSEVVDRVEKTVESQLAEVEEEVRAKERSDIAREVAGKEGYGPYYEKVKTLDFEFSYYQAAEAYIKHLKMIDDHPEAYQQNKEIVDRILREYTENEKQGSRYARQIKQIETLSLNGAFSQDVEGRLQLRLTTRAEYLATEEQSKFCRSALHYLLAGEPADDWVHTVLAEQYGIETRERRAIQAGMAVLEQMERQNELLDREQRELKERKEWESRRPASKEAVPAFLAERIKRQADARITGRGDWQRRRQDEPYQADLRVLGAFTPGYELNEAGEPRTLLDAERREFTLRYYDDMTSGDHARMTPHLERLTERQLSFRPEMRMLEDDYLIGHIAELAQMAYEMTCIENVMKSCKWYFDALPMREQDQLKASATWFGLFTAAFGAKVKLFGVDSNYGTMDTKENYAATLKHTESTYQEIRNMLGNRLEGYGVAVDGTAEYDEEMKDCRQRTPEEARELSATYARTYQWQQTERADCLNAMLENREISEAELASFKASDVYSRLQMRLNPMAGREENLRRVRSSYLFHRRARDIAKAGREKETTDPQTLRQCLADYEEIKAGCQAELLNLLHYLNALDLTEDEVLDRAQELCYTEMSAMHLSDLGKLVNPVTGQSIKQELLGDELAEAYSVINTTLTRYKTHIRSYGLGVGDETLEANRQDYSITTVDSGKSIREVLVTERRKGAKLAKMNEAKVAALQERRAAGWNPPFPPGTPPEPLYANRG